MSKELCLSVVIPVFNESSVIAELYRRTKAVLDKLENCTSELIFIDDGSMDDTVEKIERFAAADPTVVVVCLSRNFGHQNAVSAGLEYSRGDVVVVMDGDLQDPPEVIPQFLDLYHQGYDVVFAERLSRESPLFTKACYYFFYRALYLFSGGHIPLDAGDFSLMSRQVVQEINKLPEHHRFVRGLRAWVGFKQIGLPLTRPARAAGSSKYSLRKLFSLALDGLLSFSTLPIRMAFTVGLGISLLSTLFVFYSLYVRITTNQTPSGFTALLTAVVLLSGIQLIFLGIIGEYTGRTYEQVKGRPHFIVRKVTGGERS